jgi:hypothetical protein
LLALRSDTACASGFLGADVDDIALQCSKAASVGGFFHFQTKRSAKRIKADIEWNIAETARMNLCDISWIEIPRRSSLPP